MFKTIAATLGILLLASSAGEASVRNFFAPAVDGSRIDNCLSGKAECGKPAADAFCVKEGFSESILFQREAASATRQLGSDTMCEGENCISFRRIKCIGPAETAGLTQN
ncbi:MAG TPA: hypothetical protein PLL12_12145 [Aestuariivirga sp.]|nr:hypothetical protein [Aestuariivirga sp.]